MENENKQGNGSNSNQGHNGHIDGGGARDRGGVNDEQSNKNGKEEHTQRNNKEGSDQGTSEEKLSLEDREKAREIARNNPATLYHKAMEKFNPDETEPQLAEHTIYRNKDYERDGML